MLATYTAACVCNVLSSAWYACLLPTTRTGKPYATAARNSATVISVSSTSSRGIGSSSLSICPLSAPRSRCSCHPTVASQLAWPYRASTPSSSSTGCSTTNRRDRCRYDPSPGAVSPDQGARPTTTQKTRRHRGSQPHEPRPPSRRASCGSYLTVIRWPVGPVRCRRRVSARSNLPLPYQVLRGTCLSLAD